MTRRLALVIGLFVLCSVFGQAQNTRVDGVAYRASGFPAAGAFIAVCTQPATIGTSVAACTPLASLCSSASDVVCTSPNPVTADGLGNYNFYIKPGKYSYQFYGSGLTTRLQVDQTISPALDTNNNSIGTNTEASWNGVIVEDGIKNTTCSGAIAAAGIINKTIVLIPSTRTAFDCPSSIPANVTLWNFNGLADWCNPASPNIAPCYAVNWNYDDGNVRSVERHESIFNTVDLNGADIGLYAISSWNNASANAGSGQLDGFSAQADTWGTFTGTANRAVGGEFNNTIRSTGGTINAVDAVQGYIITANGSTTAIPVAISVHGFGCRFVLGVVPGACVGGWFEDQGSGGSVTNYSLIAGGKMLIQYSDNTTVINGTAPTNSSSLHFEDHLHNRKAVITNDNSDDILIQATSAAGIFLEDSTAANQLRVAADGLHVYNAIFPNAAAGSDLGTIAKPFAHLDIGTAATNAFSFSPSATSATRTVTMPDPGTNVNLAFNLVATSAGFATATTAGTCVQSTTAVTGATTAMVATASPVSTPGVGAQWSAFVSSAGNVTINECAVAASAGGTIAFNIRVTP